MSRPPGQTPVAVATSTLAPVNQRYRDSRSGISVPLPDADRWQQRESTINPGAHEWVLVGTDFTTLSVFVIEGTRIDEFVAEQRSQDIANGVDPEPDWFSETDVVGADRAVLLTQVIGPGTSSYGRTLLVEAGGFTTQVRMRLWEFDIAAAPLDEMNRFIDGAFVERP